GPTSVGIPGAVRPDLQMAYSMQYNFTIERQQWDTGFRLSYLGTNTRQGVYGYNYNSPLPDSRPYVDKPRPFPNLPDVRYTTNGAGRKFSTSSRVANLLLGGWDLGGVYTAQTGQFLTAQYTGPDPTGTAFTTSRTPANVTRRPDQLSDPNLPADQRSLKSWFDP